MIENFKNSQFHAFQEHAKAGDWFHSVCDEPFLSGKCLESFKKDTFNQLTSSLKVASQMP